MTSHRFTSNSLSPAMIIEQPRPHDVLCGKDKTYNLHHPGNRIYRDLIETKAIEYAATSNKNAKMEFTKEIVHVMQVQYGSRFLRPVRHHTSSLSCWEEISNQQARDKTSHALRFCASNNTIQKNNSKKSKAKTKNKKSTVLAMATVVSNTRHSHRLQQQQQRKGHRRTVSRDSNVSSHEQIAYSDVAYLDHAAIFSRQQAILNGMKFTGKSYGTDDDLYNYKTPMADPETVSSSSCSNQDDEDLEAILSEPINEADWDDILEL